MVVGEGFQADLQPGDGGRIRDRATALRILGVVHRLLHGRICVLDEKLVCNPLAAPRLPLREVFLTRWSAPAFEHHVQVLEELIPHELPHQRQRQLFVPLHEVTPRDADQGEGERRTRRDLHPEVIVRQPHELVRGLPLHFPPIDDPRGEAVQHAEEEEPVLDRSVQATDPLGPLKAKQAIDPIPQLSLHAVFRPSGCFFQGSDLHLGFQFTPLQLLGAACAPDVVHRGSKRPVVSHLRFLLRSRRRGEARRAEEVCDLP
mmetsp:Transcript_8566/g.21062  ORF Transcript_8566/g.21062 Transcript_8566/m.21062 type:complete len:260 (-) Transcript_8566:816-1595(-)